MARFKCRKILFITRNKLMLAMRVILCLAKVKVSISIMGASTLPYLRKSSTLR